MSDCIQLAHGGGGTFEDGGGASPASFYPQVWGTGGTGGGPLRLASTLGEDSTCSDPLRLASIIGALG